MFSSRLYLVIPLVICINYLCSCEYSPTGFYEKDIDVRVPETLALNLANYSAEDTLEAVGRTNFYYHIEPDTLPILKIIVYVDTSIAYYEENPEDSELM